MLAGVDTDRLRKLADTVERRASADVVHLTVERIEEVDYDGWVYDFEVPEHHNYVAGGMLAHNTAAMLRMYLNDLRDVDAAIIVMDPKSELSRLCLALTPPDCPKRVWFLDLGHPAFGMSPLRLTGDGPAADPGRRDRRERRRGAAGHQREPDLPEQPPLPLPRGHRRDRARRAPAAPREVRGRLLACCCR